MLKEVFFNTRVKYCTLHFVRWHPLNGTQLWSIHDNAFWFCVHSSFVFSRELQAQTILLAINKTFSKLHEVNTLRFTHFTSRFWVAERKGILGSLFFAVFYRCKILSGLSCKEPSVKVLLPFPGSVPCYLSFKGKKYWKISDISVKWMVRLRLETLKQTIAF